MNMFTKRPMINLICLTICVVCTVADIKFGQKIDAVTHILGGNDAEVGQFPYQVSLRSRNGHFCGGAIISNRFILSAAHCYRGMFASPYSVYAVVGAIHSSKDGVTYGLITIKSHPKYEASMSLNDISLLRTANRIVFTNFIQPIALPAHDFAEYGKSEVVISGWGCTSPPHPLQKPKMSDMLKFIKTSTITIKDCFAQFKGRPVGELVRNTNICTTSPVNVGACFGDSGGPLVDISNPKNKTLVGLVSFGVPCAKGYPDVYTRVYSYLDWIKSEMTQAN